MNKVPKKEHFARKIWSRWFLTGFKEFLEQKVIFLLHQYECAFSIHWDRVNFISMNTFLKTVKWHVEQLLREIIFASTGFRITASQFIIFWFQAYFSIWLLPISMTNSNWRPLNSEGPQSDHWQPNPAEAGPYIHNVYTKPMAVLLLN